MLDKDKPLVSIITVCLNSERTIEQTIQSVINQTYHNIEYIIIDGGSTDGTLEIINKYEDKISKLVSEKDEGIYDAMNKGLSFTTGEVIGIINSDDWYELDAVEAVVNAFLDDSHAKIVYGNINVYDGNNFIRTRYPSPLKEIHTGMPIPHPSVFVIGKIYRKYGFNTKYRVAADRELLLRLYSQNYRFIYINNNLANFRTGGHCYNEATNSLTSSIVRARISITYVTDLLGILRISSRFLKDLAINVKSTTYGNIRHFVI